MRSSGIQQASQWARYLLMALWLPVIHLAAWADVQAVPSLSAHVIDHTGTLTADQQATLEAKLTAFEQAKGAQVVVLMVPSTQPEDIAAYAQRVGDSWKIGRKGIGDGLLLVVAKDDHTVRIETSKALEGAIPDLAASQVIETAITPRFKQGDFAGGLEAGTGQIMTLISGEKLPTPEKRSAKHPNNQGFNWSNLAVFLFFAVPIGARALSAVLGRKLGSLTAGGVVGTLAWLVTSSVLIGGIAAVAGMAFALVSSLGGLGRSQHASGWGGSGGFGGGGGSWGSGHSNGSSGGGFGSGGGGDFGGGGASGNW